MAVTKELDILIKANYADIDTAKLKVEQLKNATVEYGKGVKIVYDETGKAINVLTDSNQKLNRQSSSLLDAMNKLSLAGKQNTNEYTLLQKRHLELATTIEKTKGNSKDLFNTLSLLPGPVGKFAQEVQGAVEILKVFSGTNLSSLKTQFVELTDTIKGAFGFGSEKKTETNATTTNVGGGTNEMTNATEKQTEALKEQNTELAKQKENYGGNAAAAKLYADDISKNNINLANTKNGLEIAGKAVKNLGKNYEAMSGFIKDSNGKMTDLMVSIKGTDGEYKFLTETQVKNIAASKVAITTDEQLAVAQNMVSWSAKAAATAVGILEAALVALGIGVVITLIVGLIDSVKEYATGAEEAAASTHKFNNELEISKKYLEIDLQTTKNVGETKLGFLKKNNADAKEIRDLEAKEIQAQLTLITNAQNDAARLQNEAVKKLEEANSHFFKGDLKDAAAENLKKADERLIQLQEQYNVVSQQLRVKDYDNELQNHKQKDDRELKNLDISIKRNIEARNTDIKQLEKDLQRKADLEAYWGHYTQKQRKDLELENNRTSLKARTEDIDSTIQTEIIKQNKLLITAKQGSDAYYEAKKALAAEEYQKELNAAMTAGDKKENLILAAENNLQTKLYALAEEKKKQQEQYQKELTDLVVAAIKDEYAKSIAARNIAYKNEKDILDKQFNDKIITQKQYDAKIILMQIALNNDLDNLEREHKIKEIEAKKAIDESRIKLLIEGTSIYYDQQRKIEEENYKIELLKAKGNAKELEKVEQEHKDTVLAIAEAEFEGKKALLLEHLAVVGNIGANLVTIAGKNKEMAIAGIRVQQAVTTADIVLNDLAAIRKSYKANPLGFGLPWSAVYAVDMITGVLAANVSANNAIENINSGGAGGAGGTGGADTINRGKNYGDGGMIEGPRHAGGGVMINAEGGEAVMTRGAVTMFKPLLSMMNQAGGGNSFSSGAAGAAKFDNPKSDSNPMEQPIIKTYVVESDLTSMQHKQARLKSLSTL